MSLDAVISADMVKTRAEIAALSSAVAAARNEIAGLNTQISGSSIIKSVQRGLITFVTDGPTELTISIAPVNPAKSVLHSLGSQGFWQSGETYYPYDTFIQLLSGNQIKASAYWRSWWWSQAKVSWELVEYK
jgi:hypothetical protein